jgi:hypothetical protein
MDYHTSRLIHMSAIVVFALPKVLAHFWKKMRKFLLGHIQNTKFFDAWCINKIS